MLRLTSTLALLPLLAPFHFDADDDLRYLAGLVERQLWNEAIPAGESFLEQHASDADVPLARLYLGEALFASGRSPAALKQFERLVKRSKFASLDEARLRFGQCCLEAGRSKDALRELDAIEKPALRETAARLAARAAFESGDNAGAKRRYEALVESTDLRTRGEAELGLAWCAFETQRWPAVAHHGGRARKELQRAGDRVGAREALQLSAEAALASGEHTRALELVADDEDAALLRGRAYAAADRLKDAERELRAALARPTDQQRAARELGVVLVRDGRPGEAIPHLRAGAAPWWLARALLDTGDARGALKALEGVPKAHRDERHAHLRGEVLTALGRNDEAEAAYRGAGTAEALYAATFTAFEAGSAERVDPLVRELVERHADDPRAFEALFLAGELAFRGGDWKGAAERFASAARTQESELRAKAATRRLWSLSKLDRHDDIIAEGSSRIANDAEVALLVGLSLRATGAAARAVKTFEAGLAANPDGPRALELAYHLGLEAEGERGVKALRRVAASEASFAPDALLALAARQEAAGRSERAASAYETFLERFAEHPLSDEARYGLAWIRYESNEREQAYALVAPISERSSSELASPANELAFWCAVSLADEQGMERHFRRLVADASEETTLDALRLLCEAGPERAELARRATDLVAQRSGTLKLGAGVERTWLELGVGELDAALLAVREVDAKRNEAPVAEAAYAVGEALLAGQRWDDAAQAFAIAERGPAPRRDEATFQRAFLALRAGQARTALDALTPLLPASREPALGPALESECLALATDAADELAEHARVLTLTQRFLEQHPRHARRLDMLLARGQAQYALAAHADAVRTLAEVSRAGSDDPRFGASELTRGLALVELGRAAQARAALTRALDAGRGDVHLARSRFGLARTDELEHNAENALAGYLKVAILHLHEPSATASLLAAARLLEADDDLAAARARLEELLERYPASENAAVARRELARLRPTR